MYEFKTRPYSHQKEALRRLLKNENYALLMEMGTGKTKVAIDEIGILYSRGQINGALIIAPKGVYRNWSDTEFPAHMPDDILNKSWIHVWDGSTSATTRRKINGMLSSNGLAILVMNVEAFSRNNGPAFKLAERFLRTRKAVVYLDESTSIKNPTAKRTKNLLKLAPLAVRRRIFTGSPVTQSPLDVFSQFNFLKSGILGFRRFTAFRARYAVMKTIYLRNRQVQVPDKFINMDDLRERVLRHAYRVKKEDCLDLPPKIYETRLIDLTDEQKKIYRSLVDDAMAQADGCLVTVTEMVTLILKLQQVVCGHLRDDDGDSHRLPTKRLDVLEQTLAEASGKVIIWSRFRPDINDIVAAIKKIYGKDSVVEYHGGVSSEQRAVAIERFQNDDKCRFFVANQQTGGYGITLTAADTVIYYSNDFSYERRIQSEDRAHRSGQKKAVTYIDLKAPRTVDDIILASLKQKKDVADYMTGDLNELPTP